MPDRCQDDSSGKGRPEAGRRTRSTVGRSEDRYDPQHIESFLPELREAVIKKCDTARALHPFASYTDNLQKVVLHFEHFYCNTGGSFCGPSGCLHQVYGSSHGRFRLMRSYYALPGD